MQEATAEIKVLCWCARRAAGLPTEAVALEMATGNRDFDWRRLLAFAKNHHMLPILYAGLRSTDARGVLGQSGWVAGPLAMRELRHQHTNISAFSFKCARIAHDICALLASRGITAIPIKGPALALLAYDNTALRQFEDLDFIVPREHIAEACRLLEQAGYRLMGPGTPRDRALYVRFLQDWVLRSDRTNIAIDLKPVVVSHTVAGTPLTDWLAGACRTRVRFDQKRELLVPSPEAMFLVVSIHGAHHCWPKLSEVTDLAALLTTYPDADWSGLLATATVHGQRCTLLNAVALIRHVFPIRVPKPFECALQAAPNRESMMRPEAARLLRGEIGSRTQVEAWRQEARTRDSLAARIRCVLRQLFVPSVVELNLVRLPSWLSWFYVLLRPYRLLWDTLSPRKRKKTRIKLSGKTS